MKDDRILFVANRNVLVVINDLSSLVERPACGVRARSLNLWSKQEETKNLDSPINSTDFHFSFRNLLVRTSPSEQLNLIFGSFLLFRAELFQVFYTDCDVRSSSRIAQLSSK